jgi:hydroxymethylglutaryl-CoA reductase
MALEEPSVVAAASSAAKLARISGGFLASSTKPLMIGQIQLTKIKDLKEAENKILLHKKEILELANKQDKILLKLGGGAKDLETKTLKTSCNKMMIVHLLVNVKNAMGANIVNTMCEKISPLLEKLTKSKAILRIISNLPIHRIIKAKAIWKKEKIQKGIINKILDAYTFALIDPLRGATHNKGIMNGIDAVAIATGNDFRAIEAGAHTYAALNKTYKPLTKYYKNKNKDLVGEIELPIAAGIVGGITQTHPITKICLKILGVKSATELCQVLASVGLAQNFAALRALVKDGIQKSHMKLHSKNIAIAAGAKKEAIDRIAHKMCYENNVSISRAKELVKYHAQN